VPAALSQKAKRRIEKRSVSLNFRGLLLLDFSGLLLAIKSFLEEVVLCADCLDDVVCLITNSRNLRGRTVEMAGERKRDLMV